MKKIIIVIVIILLSILVSIGLFYIYKNFWKEEPIVEQIITENPKEEVEEKEPTIEDKLKLENYFIAKNLERYINYFNLNPEKSLEEVISCVNANIDYDFYTNVKDAPDKKNLILINKYYKLSEDFIPNLVNVEKGYATYNAQMDEEAYTYFKQMVDAAASANIKLYSVSAYRTYETQNSYYTSYAKRDGKEAADKFSARPGYSEHQTGLATDINTASSNAHFEDTKEYAWLAENAHLYGFILRYPKGKEYLTGYKYEPWHYRYVGKEVASIIHKIGITFEEYYAYYVDND